MKKESLSGKVALITGGSRGIGRATCIKLAHEGADVAVNYTKNADAADSVVEEIESMGGSAFAIQTNVSDEEQVVKMIDEVIKQIGPIDILVNNAGITRDGFLVRMKKEAWDEVIQVNLTGAFYCLQAVSKKMIKRRSGVIINVSSIVGEIGNIGQINYAAAKAGLIGMTKTAAKELASRNIRVNGVAPGFILTDMTRKLFEDEKKMAKIQEKIPLGHFGTPQDVASTILFLVSDESLYTTGQILDVNGGLDM